MDNMSVHRDSVDPNKLQTSAYVRTVNGTQSRVGKWE